ncbi:MAG: hypothetical protein RL026_2346 [Pseudomonadota bacterium]
MRHAHPLPLILAALLLAGCATTEPAYEASLEDEGESPLVIEEPEPVEPTAVAAEPEAGETAAGEDATTVALPADAEEDEEAEAVAAAAASDGLTELLVVARARHDVIRDLVREGQALLHSVDLQYVFTGRGRNEVLRGRPVAFSLWSEKEKAWTIAHIEIPRPPVRYRPGRRPLQFRVITPGIEARHVKGTGAERLMFAFTRNGEPLKVYGRKFPVFDSSLLKRKQWRAVAASARPLIYLPFTEDTLDPRFVSGGREFLLETARRAAAELREARAPSLAYPGQWLADVVPPEVIATLAVIEQTDDADYRRKGLEAFDEILSQYGLKREDAYRHSVSSAAALGAMQFTNRRGNGTYALVVRRCPAAKLDPNFERGATNLYNAMKAAICLLDLELAQMPVAIREAYRIDPAVLGIFPVAAYNGGPRNVARLSRVLRRMKVDLDQLRRVGEMPENAPVSCPCLWREDARGVRPVAIPRYNNENRWYIEKYQNILGLFEQPEGPPLADR